MAENTLKTSNLKLNELENQLLFTQCNGFPRALDRPSFNLEKQKETMHRKARSKTRGKIKVTCCSQGKGLTVTSACDLGETCHLGLSCCMRSQATGWHAPGSIIAFRTVNDSKKLSRILRPAGRLNQEYENTPLPPAASRLVPTHILESAK